MLVCATKGSGRSGKFGVRAAYMYTPPVLADYIHVVLLVLASVLQMALRSDALYCPSGSQLPQICLNERRQEGYSCETPNCEIDFDNNVHDGLPLGRGFDFSKATDTIYTNKPAILAVKYCKDVSNLKTSNYRLPCEVLNILDRSFDANSICVNKTYHTLRDYVRAISSNARFGTYDDLDLLMSGGGSGLVERMRETQGITALCDRFLKTKTISIRPECVELTPTFLRYLAQLDETDFRHPSYRALIETHGTHVIVGVHMGGRLQAHSLISACHAENFRSAKATVDAGLLDVINFHLGVKSSLSQAARDVNAQASVTVYGGNASYTNFSQWIDYAHSVRGQEAVISFSELKPLDELVECSVSTADDIPRIARIAPLLRMALDDYINSSQIAPPHGFSGAVPLADYCKKVV
ncbi:uncharacterized protein LOC135829889 [Sycon ciliatum]|uniref:uncharacterized protein LOC135829889 n=1 Tax=Sycon ciliatum TaxID=27933 RepID=UPI0031F65F7D